MESHIFTSPLRKFLVSISYIFTSFLRKLSVSLSLIFASLFLMPAEPVAAQSLSTLYKGYRMLRGAYKAYEAYSITDEDLQEYMSEAIKQEDRKHKVCSSSSSYGARLKKITRGLTDIDGVPLNFKVYQDSKTANAFASPDGSVRVYSKLMDLMTDNELLGIIGHEIGHVAGHHSLKELKASLYASAAREGLMATERFSSLASGTLGTLSEVLINAKYSRVQESEADDYGYDFLKDSGKNPAAMAQALYKIQKLENSSDGKYSRALKTLFSTHPDIKKRVQRMKEKAEDDGYTCQLK